MADEVKKVAKNAARKPAPKAPARAPRRTVSSGKNAMLVRRAQAARARRAEMAEAFKIQVARLIASEIADRGLTQTEAARIMSDAPSQVSLVCTAKLRGFSLERLLTMAVALGVSFSVHASVDAAEKNGKIVVHIPRS